MKTTADRWWLRLLGAGVPHAATTPSLQAHDPFGLVGTLLGSRYRVEGVVEETRLSVVYRAMHCVWRRRVAIKAFKAPDLGEEARQQLLEAFVREGALLAELSERTAAVCQARDVASVTTADGHWVPYMVLEWLDGEPLEALLARERGRGGRRRSIDEAMHLLEPVARALALAHQLGIVHRDVKPGNICVLADGSQRASGPTKLLDFGIAAVARAGEAHGPGALLDSFTPWYGAPEQFFAERGPIGPWTDVFALALVFVELLAGREALEGGSIAALAVRACDPARRPTPRTLGLAAPDQVERVLTRALAVDTGDRFEDAGAFWTALARAANEARLEASGSLPIPLLRRRSRAPQRTPAAPGA